MLPSPLSSTARVSGGAEDHDASDEQGVVQPVPGQESPALLADLAEHADQADQPKQPECTRRPNDPERAQERQDDDEQSGPLTANEAPSAVGQSQANDVLHGKDCPNEPVGGDEGGLHRVRQVGQ
jgi:hypothetical protein